MQIETIRRLAGRRPWRPLEILVNGGDRIVIRHPEAIFIGKRLIFVEYPDGSGDFFEAETVSKIRRVGRRPANAR